MPVIFSKNASHNFEKIGLDFQSPFFARTDGRDGRGRTDGTDGRTDGTDGRTGRTDGTDGRETDTFLCRTCHA